MGYLEDIKDWIIEHKKLVIIVLVIIALLVIILNSNYCCHYIAKLLKWVCPSLSSEYIPPSDITIDTPSQQGGYESLPQLYL